MKTLEQKVEELQGSVDSLTGVISELQKQIEEVGRRAGNFQPLGPGYTNLPNGVVQRTGPCLREGKSPQECMMLYCGCSKCSTPSLTVNMGMAVDIKNTTFFDIGTDGSIKPRGTDGKN